MRRRAMQFPRFTSDASLSRLADLSATHPILATAIGRLVFTSAGFSTVPSHPIYP